MVVAVTVENGLFAAAPDSVVPETKHCCGGCHLRCVVQLPGDRPGAGARAQPPQPENRKGPRPRGQF